MGSQAVHRIIKERRDLYIGVDRKVFAHMVTGSTQFIALKNKRSLNRTAGGTTASAFIEKRLFLNGSLSIQRHRLLALPR